MNIASNPWSLVNGDTAIGTITGVTGLTLNADGTVTITTTLGYSFNANFPSSQWFTVTGAAAAAYNGFYKIISGASGASSFVMAPQFLIPSGTAQSGSGTIAQCLYPWGVRVEDISWQNQTAAGDTLELRDRMGNPIWQAKATGANAQNRGKVYWVNGITPITITSGVVLITIN